MLSDASGAENEFNRKPSEAVPRGAAGTAVLNKLVYEKPSKIPKVMIPALKSQESATKNLRIAKAYR
jgi:hypothetical protein